MAVRSRKALFIFCYFGFVGMAPDIDHLICCWLDVGACNWQTGEFGCRLFHDYILPVSWYIGSIGIALLFGLWVVGIGLAIQQLTNGIRTTLGVYHGDTN